jgi:hypothetical protein
MTFKVHSMHHEQKKHYMKCAFQQILFHKIKCSNGKHCKCWIIRNQLVHGTTNEWGNTLCNCTDFSKSNTITDFFWKGRYLYILSNLCMVLLIFVISYNLFMQLYSLSLITLYWEKHQLEKTSYARFSKEV